MVHWLDEDISSLIMVEKSEMVKIDLKNQWQLPKKISERQSDRSFSFIGHVPHHQTQNFVEIS